MVDRGGTSRFLHERAGYAVGLRRVDVFLNAQVRDVISGTGFTNNLDLTSYRKRCYDDSGLSYTDASGNTLNVVGLSGGLDAYIGGTKNMQLGLTAGPISNGVVYVSYLFDNQGTNASSFKLGLLDGATTSSGSMTGFMQAMVADDGATWGNYGKASGLEVYGGPDSTSFGLHFAVSKVDLDAGTMTTYFDPSDLSDVVGSASHTVSSAAGASLAPITHFGFALGNTIAYIDEIRLGTTIGDVTPYTALAVSKLYAYEGFDTANAIGSDASAAGVTGSGFAGYTIYPADKY